MAEPGAITITVAACAATGAVLHPLLCKMGLDPISMGAGLLGCVAMQLLLRAEEVKIVRVVATAVGSVIFATLGTPFAVLFAAAAGWVPNGASLEQTQPFIAALLGFLAKPGAALIYKLFSTAQKRILGEGAGDAS